MRARLTGWGIAVPEGRLTNAELERRVNTNDAWIVERTGIRERRVAAPDETTATLSIEAGTAAIKSAGLTPDQIDLMMIATVTPEMPIPHTGAYVGEGIGLSCGSFDLNAGCSGWVYELVLAASMIEAAGMDHVLIMGAETLSRIIDPLDRDTSILFGDGAAAFVVSRGPAEPAGLLAYDLGCDGSAAGHLIQPGGGSRMPASLESVANRQHYVKMAGKEVFRRAVRAVTESAAATMASAGVTLDDIAWFVPHQANLRIIEAAATRIGFPMERVVVNLEHYGNTSGATVPLALAEAADEGRFHDGDLILITGFGAGMTWASALVRWGRGTDAP